jgi:uncharacterized membrane protein
VKLWLRDHSAWSRLVFSLLVGIVVFFLTPGRWQPALRGEVGWVTAVTLTLVLALLAVGDASPAHCRRHARNEDERAWVITAIIIAAVAVSLGSLGLLLRKDSAPAGTAALRSCVALVSVVVSWLLTHTTFAFRYAHHYYGDPVGPATERRGLEFPGKDPPDYWDFFYYSFVVGMTCQVSDVQVTSSSMRKLTLSHGILSFFFNAGVLALAVNILAGLL